MTDWRALKFQTVREMEFPSTQDLVVIGVAMSRTKPDQKDEQPRGPRLWESVRASKIKRAKALLKDPNYPSKKTLGAVAEILAKGLTSERKSRAK